jgi:hypothetical protein
MNKRLISSFLFLNFLKFFKIYLFIFYRQKEFELLLERDAQLGRAAKAEYELKAKLDRELYEQFEARRKTAKQDKHYAMCGRIVDYFVGILSKGLGEGGGERGG